MSSVASKTSLEFQRVVFENGHCLLPKQATQQLYVDLLDEDVRKVAGAILGVHDVAVDSLSVDSTDLSVRVENICGEFRAFHEELPFAGVLLRRNAIRVGAYEKNVRFAGTHRLFNTVYGRFTYHDKGKSWKFQGCRSLESMVELLRDLTQDRLSPIFPRVTTLSATLRTGASIVIDPSRSLFNRVVLQLYATVVALTPRADDINNLYFMELLSWSELLRVVTECWKGESDTGSDSDVRFVRAYLLANKIQPAVSIGYTRRGVFFIRISFKGGCICEVNGSNGIDPARTPNGVCEGGVDPFVQVVVRFILILLVKMRVV